MEVKLFTYHTCYTSSGLYLTQNLRLGNSTSVVNPFAEMFLVPAHLKAGNQRQYSTVKPATFQPKWVCGHNGPESTIKRLLFL